MLCVRTKGATMHRPRVSVRPPKLSAWGTETQKNAGPHFPVVTKKTCEIFYRRCQCPDQKSLCSTHTHHPLGPGVKNSELERSSCFPWDPKHHLSSQYALLLPTSRLQNLWSSGKPSLLLLTKLAFQCHAVARLYCSCLALTKGHKLCGI